MKIYLLFFFFISSATSLGAQQRTFADTNAVKSIDGIVKEFLRLQSSEKGKTRNWEALRNLFLPTASFTILNVDSGDSLYKPTETISLDDFIDLLHEDYYEAGYFEYETGKTIEEFNGIATVFQSFYGKDSKNEEARGINSYQLVFFEKRWWIANLLWTLETKEVKIPKKYLSRN